MKADPIQSARAALVVAACLFVDALEAPMKQGLSLRAAKREAARLDGLLDDLIVAAAKCEPKAAHHRGLHAHGPGKGLSV